MDFLINDFKNLTVLPLEIKSGKDYTVHSALDKFLNEPEYNIHSAIVFSNDREVNHDGGITYMPIYYAMYLQHTVVDNEDELIIRPKVAPRILRT